MNADEEYERGRARERGRIDERRSQNFRVLGIVAAGFAIVAVAVVLAIGVFAFAQYQNAGGFFGPTLKAK